MQIILKECLYCDTVSNQMHFTSDCCGRGMCANCFDGTQGTDDQLQVHYADNEDLETIKPEYLEAHYLCFDCADIWQLPTDNK